MCGENGLLTSDRWLTGYVKPLGHAWKQVSYADVDGMAVFEGCIILGSTEEIEDSRVVMERRLQGLPELLTDPHVQTFGIGIRGRQHRWPSRTVPIEIDPALPKPERVLDAIRHWEQHTTIRFVKRRDQTDYVQIKRVASGCASAVGRQGGAQQLVLADSCGLGNVIHELGHAIGLWHEQSRSDREKYIRINQARIDPNAIHNFDQHVLDGDNLGDYDLGSIMHYGPLAFSTDGKSPTIETLKPLPAGFVMGQRQALSAGDIKAVERLYANEPLAHA